MRKKIIFVVVALVLLNCSHALMPAISVSPLSIEKKISFYGDMDLYFYVIGEGGDEPLLAELSVSGDMSRFVSFNQEHVWVEPNETKRIDFHVESPEKLGVHEGRIEIFSKGEQVNWVDLKFNVSRNLGRFKIECLEKNHVLDDFTVLVYKDSTLVYEQKSQTSYLFTDYLPYGQYTVIVRKTGYNTAQKIIDLLASERILSFDLVPHQETSLTLYPSRLIVQGCESQAITTFFSLENSGTEQLDITFDYPKGHISLQNNSIMLLPSGFEKVPVSINGMPPGNHTFTINMTYSGYSSSLPISLNVLPLSQCGGRDIFENISFDNHVFVHRGFTRYVPVYLDIGDYLGSLGLQIQGTSSFEVFPRAYQNVQPGDELVFLVKIFSPRDETAILRFSSNYGSAIYNLAISTKDTLDSDLVSSELESVKSFYEFLKTIAIQNTVEGKNMERPLTLINGGLISFDLVSDILRTDPVSAKQTLDESASDLPEIINSVYYREVNPEPPYFLLIFLLIIPLAIFFFRMKQKEEQSKSSKKEI